MKVKCNWCDEVFDEEEIVWEYDSYLGEQESCPHCGSKGCLMDLESEVE